MFNDETIHTVEFLCLRLYVCCVVSRDCQFMNCKFDCTVHDDVGELLDLFGTYILILGSIKRYSELDNKNGRTSPD